MFESERNKDETITPLFVKVIVRGGKRGNIKSRLMSFNL